MVTPNFQMDRVLVAINQANIAIKGRHWDGRLNRPDSVLQEFLEGKANSVRSRLAEATRAKVTKPVYYSTKRRYNIEKLLNMMIDNMPKERRRLVA